MVILQRTRLVVIRRLFGQVKELWGLDMGLGTCQGEFEAKSEEEYEDWLQEDEEMEEDNNVELVEVSDDDSEEVDMLLNEVGQPGFGGRN